MNIRKYLPEFCMTKKEMVLSLLWRTIALIIVTLGLYYIPLLGDKVFSIFYICIASLAILWELWIIIGLLFYLSLPTKEK